MSHHTKHQVISTCPTTQNTRLVMFLKTAFLLINPGILSHFLRSIIYSNITIALNVYVLRKGPCFSMSWFVASCSINSKFSDLNSSLSRPISFNTSTSTLVSIFRADQSGLILQHLFRYLVVFVPGALDRDACPCGSGKKSRILIFFCWV